MIRKILLLSMFALAFSLYASRSAYQLITINGVKYWTYTDQTAEVKSFSTDIPSEVTIPENIIYSNITYKVTAIQDYAFEDCKAITSVSLPESLTSIGKRAFYSCSQLEHINIPQSIASIEQETFGHCYKLSEVSIPDNITYIGLWAFQYCNSLRKISLPESITSTGSSIFEGCTFDNVELNYNANNNIFNKVSINTLTIGTNVTSVPSNTTGSIKKIIFLPKECPDNAHKLTASISYAMNNSYETIENIKIYPLLSSRFDVDGTIYVPVNVAQRTCDIIDCNYDDTSEAINIQPTVNYRDISLSVNAINPFSHYNNKFIKTAIINYSNQVGDSAFCKCTNLNRLSISETVTDLNIGAFANCSSLSTLNLENNGNIGKKAFAFCSAISELNLNNNGSVGSSVFYSCTSLRSLTIGERITSLGTYCFYGCSSLPSITIPAQITKLPNYAVYNCSKISSIYISERTTPLTLGTNGNNPIFSTCPLESIHVAGDIEYSGNSPFANIRTLKSIIIDGQSSTIYNSEFTNCDALETVSIGNNVKSIGDNSFSDCTSLKSIILGTNVETIGTNAFSGCTALTSLESNNPTPPTCGTNALTDIDKWSCTLHVPASAVTAYQNAKQWQDFFFIDSELSDIEDIEIDRIDNGSIRVENRCIIFDGFDPEAIAEVYTTSGYIIYKGNATKTYQLPQGIYIVKTTNHTFKVAIR